MTSPEEVLQLLNAAVDAASDALSDIPFDGLRRRATGHPDQFELDLVVDRAIRKVLAVPGVRILSEESGWNGVEQDLVIVVDPIDGSVNASRRIGFFGPSLCAVDSRGALAAVVLNVPTGRRYAAIRGAGATVNGVQMSSRISGGVNLIATGDPCPYLERLPEEGVLPVYTRLSGASAHDLCLVAEGAYDGYVDCVNTQSIWDYLGGSLVLVEAGGAIHERNGIELANVVDPRPRKIIAAGSPHQLRELSVLVTQTHTEKIASH